MRARPSVRRALRAASVAAGISFLLAAPALAQAEGGWDQYQGDAARTGVAVQAPEPPYKRAWEREAAVGTPEELSGFPVPIVVGDLAVVVGPESVVAIDVTDGSEAWSVDRALGPSVPAAAGESADGTVILVTEGGGAADASPRQTASSTGSPTATVSPAVDLETSSILLGLDAATGARLWERPLPALSRTGAAVVGDGAFVGTDGGDVIAIDVATGEERWTVKAGDEVRLPLAATGDLILAATTTTEVGGTSSLVALGVADGTEAWRHTPSAAVGSPAVGGDVAFVALGDRTVEALRLSDGITVWSSTMNQSGGLTPVVLEDSVVAVDVLGQVYAFDATDGAQIWDHALNVGVFGPPIAVPGAILVPGAAGAVAALDPVTGELIFRTAISSGYVLGLAAAPDAVVASVTGSSPGLTALAHDDAGTLVRVPSPTIPDPPALLGAWLIAALPLSVLLWFGGRWLWDTLTPLDLPTEDDLTAEDPDEVDAEDDDEAGDA